MKKKLKDQTLMLKAEECLTALGYMPQWDFFYAMQTFVHFNYGLYKSPTMSEIVEMLKEQCRSERVGPYEPYLNYDEGR
tara:strand:+ start:416 stop:652 length:237 start_codon:yes stop_codon:yes gene_type:complete